MMAMAHTQNTSDLRSAKHPRNVQLIALIAMASFGMLFGTLVLSFLLAEARNAVWPPIGVQPINPVYAYLATGVILASSLVYSNAHKHRSKWSYLGALVLAGLFLVLQYVTLSGLWVHGQNLRSDIYSGSVHLLIGLHAIHLLGGVAGLAHMAFWTFVKPQSVSEITSQIVGWFWHFLGFLWGLIFLVLVL